MSSSDISTIYYIVFVVLSNSVATLAMGEHKLRKVGGAVRWLWVIHLVCLCQCSRMWHCRLSHCNGRLFVSVDQGSIVTADCVTCSGDGSHLNHRRFCWLIEKCGTYIMKTLLILASGWRPSATPQQPLGALHLMTHREMCEVCTTRHFAPPPHCSIASLQHCTRVMFLSITDCRGRPGLACYHQQPQIIDIRY